MDIDGLCITFLAKEQGDLIPLLTPHFKLEFLTVGFNDKITFRRTVGNREYQATVTRYWEEKDFRGQYVKLQFYGKSSRFLLELDILKSILDRAIGCPRLDIKVWHNTVITNQDLVLFYSNQMKREMFRKEQGKRYQKMQMLQSKEGDVSVKRRRCFSRDRLAKPNCLIHANFKEVCRVGANTTEQKST